MSRRFEVLFGPRTSWASDGYMETYFGVTQKEASRNSMLTAYKPEAGFKTAGLAATANYWLDERTRLQVRGSWNRLIGDAGLRDRLAAAGEKRVRGAFNHEHTSAELIALFDSSLTGTSARAAAAE